MPLVGVLDSHPPYRHTGIDNNDRFYCEPGVPVR